MKKFTLCAILIMAVTVSYSQITITSQNAPTAGTTIVMSVDEFPVGINPGSPGPNQTWDFTSFSEDETEAIEFILPSSTPFPNYFPDANMALTTDDTTYNYMKVTASSWTYIGGAGQIDGSIFTFNNEPEAIVVNFPVNYGDQFSQEYSHTTYLSFGEDSVKFKNSVSSTDDVDSWGSVSTPSGTYDALRVKTEETQTDSIWFKFGGTWMLKDASSTSFNSYSWYTDHPSVGINLLNIYYDETWENIEDADYFKDSFVGIGEPKVQVEINVYPNPATDWITIETNHNFAGKFRIYDLSGKSVLEEEISQGSNKINVSALKTGIYTYSFIGDDSDSVKSGHFTILSSN